jgi:hypothetical protein
MLLKGLFFGFKNYHSPISLPIKILSMFVLAYLYLLYIIDLEEDSGLYIYIRISPYWSNSQLLLVHNVFIKF